MNLGSALYSLPNPWDPLHWFLVFKRKTQSGFSLNIQRPCLLDSKGRAWTSWYQAQCLKRWCHLTPSSRAGVWSFVQCIKCPCLGAGAGDIAITRWPWYLARSSCLTFFYSVVYFFLHGKKWHWPWMTCGSSCFWCWRRACLICWPWFLCL